MVMGHQTNSQIKRAVDEGVDMILKELKELKGRLPAGLHIESGWADEERNKKKDNDWSIDLVSIYICRHVDSSSNVVWNENQMIEVFIWSILVVTWASVGMHVIKEYVRNHIE